MMNPIAVERMFWETAINTYNKYPTNVALQANRDALNSLADVAFCFMTEVGLRTYKLRGLLLSMGYELEEIADDVTCHYISKWEELWRNTSPEYYLASVMKQLYNRVLDICKGRRRRRFDDVPIHEVEFCISDDLNLEDQFSTRESVLAALEYIRIQPRFYAIALLGTKFLGIKNAVLSHAIDDKGFIPVSQMILDDVIQYYHLPLDYFEKSFKNDLIPQYDNCRELSVYLSKASNACAVSVKKKMQPLEGMSR